MKMMIFPWKWWFSHENDAFPMKTMIFPWKTIHFGVPPIMMW